MGWGWCGHCSDGTLHSEHHRGGDFWAAKAKNEPCMLDFSTGCANLSSGRRVGIWGGVGVAVAVMAHCVRKIARVVTFGLQNRKTSHACSILAQGAQFQAQWVQGMTLMSCTQWWGPALK